MQSQRNRVVAHFNDGRLIKGYTHDFLPEKESFHIIKATAQEGDASQELRISDLKAVFFVKTFEGNKDYKEKIKFEDVDASIRHGIKIKVTFKDGEILRGFSLGYGKTKKGFFIIPIDPMSNNERVYVVAASTKEITVGPAAET